MAKTNYVFQRVEKKVFTEQRKIQFTTRTLGSTYEHG